MPRVTDPSVLAQLAPPGGLGGVVIGSHAANPLKVQEDQGRVAAQQQEATSRQIQIERDRIKLAQERENAEAAKIKPSGDKHGPDFLATLPPARAHLIRDIALGNITLGPRPFSNPQNASILQDVVNFDPTFDMTDFGARAKSNAAFRTGTQGQNATALNTALEHGLTVKQTIENLGNKTGLLGSLYNPVKNAWLSWNDNPAPKEIGNSMRAFGGEAERVFASGQGDKAGREGWQDSIDVNDGPKTQMAILKQDAGLFKSRLKALQYQEQQALGPYAKLGDLLSPDAQAAYAQLIGDAPGQQQQVGPAALGLPTPAGPPTVGGVPPRGGPPGGIQGSTPVNPGGGPAAPAVDIATGATRNEPDPIASAAIERLIRQGKSPAAIMAAFPGYTNLNEQTVGAVQKYLKTHPDYSGFVTVGKGEVPQNLFQQAAASPIGATVAGADNAVLGGLTDELAGVGSAITGGDYTQSRDLFDAKKKALAGAFPKSDIAGNIAGGIGATLLGGAALKAAPGTLGAIQAALGRAAPIVGDAAYGAAYGAGENNDNRLLGGGLGAVVGAGGGALARKGTQGLSRLIAPTGGDAAPLYQQGVFPTLGQRFGKTGTIGRAINTIEQGVQSIPFVGSAVAGARQGARDQFQIGAFNDALGEIGLKLPDGVAPGTQPHVIAKQAFDNAYDTARSGMRFAPDKQYLGDLQGFVTNLGDGTLTKEQADQVGKVIQSKVGSRLSATGGVLNGDTYKIAASDLGKVAQDWSKTDPLKADALNSYISIFDDAARRNSSPDAVNALDAADRGYAKLVRIQDAAARRGGDAGTFTPTQLDSSVQNNSGGVRSSAYNQGDALMQDYGDAGKSLVDTLNNSGSEDRKLIKDLVTGGAVNTLAAGAAYTHPVAAGIGMAGLIPYLPGVRNLATKLIAPRASTLPSILADPMNAVGAQIYNRAGAVGRIGAPGAIGALSLLSPDLAFLGGGQ